MISHFLPIVSPIAPYCGRSDQRVTEVLGEVHLSPESFEQPEDVHGVLNAAYPDGLTFSIRF